MSTHAELAQRIIAILQQVEGFTGRTYAYVPNLSALEELVQALTDAEGRINVWFVTRTGLSTARYGEGRRVVTWHRIKTHQYTIRGYVAVRDDSEASEMEFQALCDRIEETLGKRMSLGVEYGTTMAKNISASIGYDTLGNVLCHVCTLTLTVDEVLATQYQL